MSYIWIVSLSDGRKFNSKDLIGEDKSNPMMKLVDYLRKNPIDPTGKELYITHMEIVCNGIRYNSPTLSKASMFPGTTEVKNFWVFYNSSSRLDKPGDTTVQVAYSYKCGDYRHFFWVNTSNNFTYSQVLNVVNPKNEIEKHFSHIETSMIEPAYAR